MTDFRSHHTATIRAITQEADGSMTPEQALIHDARISNPSNERKHMTGERLMNTLMREAHWSPFEMVSVKMEIHTTRDIARQILRHWSMRFQEFSQRYADVSVLSGEGDGLVMVPRECRMQDPANRQSSIPASDLALQDSFQASQERNWRQAVASYRWAIKAGVAKEQARAFLPEGNTPTRLHINADLRTWLHYTSLRRGNGTQAEHQWVADSVYENLSAHFPRVIEAWEARQAAWAKGQADMQEITYLRRKLAEYTRAEAEDMAEAMLEGTGNG